MAVQLPNFLGAQLINPDYSGLGDIFQNYYGGKALKQQDIIGQNQAKAAPLDLLMKQIQSEFARPNAETALAGAKLTNQSTQLTNRQAQMTMQKLQQELGNEARFNAAMKAAQAAQAAQAGQRSGQGGGVGMGGGQGGMMPQGINPNMMPQGNQPTIGNEAPTGAAGVRQQINGTALQKGLMEIMQHPMMQNQNMLTQAPLMNDHPEEMAQARQSVQSTTQPKSTMQEIHSGNPAEYFVDKMWNDEPGMRPYLIKRGYKAPDVKEVYDKKTGATRVTTTWPSGRKTVKTIMPPIEQDEGEDIPLSKSGMGKVEDEIRGADVLVPYLDTIIDIATPTNDLIKEKQNLSKTDESKSKNIDRIKKIDEALKGRNTAGGIYNETQMPYFSNVFGFNFPSNASAKYHRIVNKALESYASSGKLPKTNESIERVHQILSRGTNESNKQFYEQLVQERKEQIEKRARNVKLMKKGISRFGTSSLDPETQSYSSNEWEVTGEK